MVLHERMCAQHAMQPKRNASVVSKTAEAFVYTLRVHSQAGNRSRLKADRPLRIHHLQRNHIIH
jgi:hypothetical protein